jgi:hypothetical protein
LAGCCECGDEPSGSGATELVIFQAKVFADDNKHFSVSNHTVGPAQVQHDSNTKDSYSDDGDNSSNTLKTGVESALETSCISKSSQKTDYVQNVPIIV